MPVELGKGMHIKCQSLTNTVAASDCCNVSLLCGSPVLLCQTIWILVWSLDKSVRVVVNIVLVKQGLGIYRNSSIKMCKMHP